jgi:hypothetical protein
MGKVKYRQGVNEEEFVNSMRYFLPKSVVLLNGKTETAPIFLTQ